jgi:hypothetical protein
MAFPKIAGIRTVSGKERRELLKLPWVRDEDLSHGRHEARVLPDGRVLDYMGDHIASQLYPSREAYAAVRRAGEDLIASGPTIDPTRTLLPPIDDFLRDVEGHARALGKALGVPEEALDRSQASLDVAYKAVLRLRKAKRMTPEVLTPLTAYAGEVMRAACDGKWTRSLVRHHENEPMIQAHDGGLFQPFAIVLVEVTEHGARGSLRGAVTGALARYLGQKRTGTTG